MSTVTLLPESVLFASPHVQATVRPDGRLEIDTPDAVLTFDREDAQQVGNWLAAAAEPRSALALARGEVDWRRFIALMEPALKAGAVRDVSSFMMAQNSDAQMAAYYELCDSWARDIFLGRFWAVVLSGKASARLMLGWCEQFYHRTVGADEHNEIAVVHCTIPEVAAELRSHFGEEVGHGEIFLQGLEAAGVPREDVLRRTPLPSTRGLIDFFGELGRADTLAYLACYGVLHSPREGQTLQAVREQFAALANAYPEAAPAIRRVGEHAEIDVYAGHDQIAFDSYLRAREPLRGDEARRVLMSVRGTVQIFNRFFDGILVAYDRP